MLGKANESLESYDKAIAINPKTWWIHYDRAILLIRMKNDLMAMVALKKVLKLKSTNGWAYFELANITYRQKKYVNSLKYYLQAKQFQAKIMGLDDRIKICRKRILAE
ncbi:hypothetical protein MJH12_13870 [bacterium]|nr:hypothetical protein [bacterium]